MLAEDRRILIWKGNKIIKLSFQNTNMTHKFKIGLDGRTRDENGQIHHKRGDTLVGTIEKQYGVDLGARSDMKLENYLKKVDEPSITQVFKNI